MRNACTFLTRRCLRSCNYCDASKVKKEDELDVLDWIQVNDILRKLNIDFNLILGNECWLLENHLNKIMTFNKVPYAIYTTCEPTLFYKCRDAFFGEKGKLDNLSCGIDYSQAYLEKKCDTDDEKKSADGWRGLYYTRRNYPHVDCQGTVTVSKRNFKLLPEIVNTLSSIGVFVGINVIHHNKDGKFDFFPEKDFLKEYLFTKREVEPLKKIFKEVQQMEGALVQNIEMVKPELVEHMIATDWHCRGNPYGGPTIDSDGSLRCCGYRKGERASRFSIFDMPNSFDHYMQAVEKDARECPGCFWSYPWMYKYWEKRPEFGKAVFINHAKFDSNMKEFVRIERMLQ